MGLGDVANSTRFKTRLSSLLIFVALTLTGCSFNINLDDSVVSENLVAWENWRSERPPTATVRMDEKEKLAFREQQLLIYQDHLEEMYGVAAEIPELIRWTLYSEGPETWVRCLNEAGWDATLVEGGGILTPQGLSPEQQPAYSVAEFTCFAQYFRDPNFSQALTEEQYGVFYDYKVSWFMPCVEAEGYGFDTEIPTRGIYVTNENPFVLWDPFLDITRPYRVVESSEEGQALQRVCPRNPPDAALWPS